MKAIKRLFRTEKRPLDNVTPRAQQLLIHARRQADRFSHASVGAEHLLLGLLSYGEGIGIATLASLGGRSDAIRSEIEAALQHGSQLHVQPTIPGREEFMVAMRLAAAEAEALGHTYLGTEHLLIALFQSPNGVVRNALTKVCADLSVVRATVTKVLSDAVK